MVEREEIYGEDVTPSISVTGTPCLDATWLATNAEAQAKALTTKVITCSNLAALNATTTMSGFVEKATPAELENGTVDRYADASQLLLRRIMLSGAIVGGDFTGNARGTDSMDIQIGRTLATQVASGVLAFAFGYANTVSGNYSSAFGLNNTVPGINAVAIGVQAQATGNGDVAIGSTPIASGGSSFAVGVNAQSPGFWSVAIGGSTLASGGQSAAIGRTATASGYSAVAIGNLATASGDYAITLGSGGTASGYYSVAIGNNATASGYGSVAIGFGAASRIDYTLNTLPIINRKDTAELAVDAWRKYAGAEVVLMSKEINLETAADQTLTLPAGCHFYPNEVGVIATNVVGPVVTQPTVRFGWTGSLAGLIGAVITTALTATFTRERYTALLNYNGQVSLTGGVTIAGNAGTYLGRFYWKGMLIEDE